MMAPKTLIIVLLFSCVLSVLSAKPHKPFVNGPRLNPNLQELCDSYWDWKLMDMPQFATFVGVHDYDALLDDMSEGAFVQRLNKCEQFLALAEEIEPSLTEDADIINMNVLKYELNTFIDFYHLKGFFLPVSSLEGPQVDMEKIFGWMLKDTLNDYDVMISRLEKIPLYINQLIDLLKAGVSSNITYHAISVAYMNESISPFLVEDPTQSPLYVNFNGSFPDTFTPEDITNLQQRAQTTITNAVTPAYSALLQYFETEYVTRPEIAATTINNGEEFYNSLIWYHTSTNYTATEIQNIGFSEVDRIESLMYEIIVELGFGNLTTHEFSDMIRADPNNYYDNADELMEGFNSIVHDFVPPHLPEIFKNLPQAELEVVADTSPHSAGAYYLVGSFDGSRPGVFYVSTYNPGDQPKYNMISLSLHEGNPGHHLQGSHSIESSDFPYFRRITDDRNYGLAPSKFPVYSAFIEGWGLYAESLGFDMNLYGDPLDRYGHYSEEIFRACRLVVDTGMHALGWTRDQAVEYMMNHTASARNDIEDEINRYITWPGQALAYKIGQLKFSQLRSDSEAALGSLFDIKDFHDVVLNSVGSFDIVEDEVNKWVNATLNNNFVFNSLPQNLIKPIKLY